MKGWFAEARFGSFACGHFLLSLLWAGVFMSGIPHVVPLVALAMACYIPVGFGFARYKGWPRGNGRTFALSVLRPALFAWLWGSLALLSLLGTGVTGGWIIPIFLCGSLMLLASPSATLGLLCLSVYSPLSDYLVMAGAVFVAGLLPPLLFWVGGWLGSKPAQNQLTTAENVIE